MKRRELQAVPVALMLLLGCFACGGEGGLAVSDTLNPPNENPFDPPEPLTIEGEWSTNATEVLDTCGFDPAPSYSPLLVEGNNDQVLFTFADGYGGCEESVRLRAGDTVSLTRTDTFDAGCGMVRVQSNIVYEFDGDEISGAATHQYSMLSGNCGNVPCTYQLGISGTRCEGCFPGCATAPVAPRDKVFGSSPTPAY